ncbi:PREDICTED: uncharacterized protein LOC105953726 [Erythranthe guttata]|uniref:uncharacterized protein LOC105953726 n=1 Tax=Erythranthe guttata TaxID=4155 RepID=UPI00064D89B8|nr:PREDICTED: uncharacterized protein LOC105953726 [Erythranthe guttata]|eukprot:XP_012832869.1 PREDICTED: uncharacterized protein LOC105953726 [Erythranthe guttata]
MCLLSFVDGGITFAALRAKANGTSKKASKKVPSKLGGSSNGLPREEVHVESPRVVADDRSSAGVVEERPPKRDRGKGKRVDTEYVAVPKRPRVDPEETYAFHGGGGKQLFTYGVNRDGKESYWDVSDHDLPLLSTEGFVREYDRARMSGKGPSHMLELAGGDICRVSLCLLKTRLGVTPSLPCVNFFFFFLVGSDLEIPRGAR